MYVALLYYFDYNFNRFTVEKILFLSAFNVNKGFLIFFTVPT